MRRHLAVIGGREAMIPNAVLSPHAATFSPYTVFHHDLLAALLTFDYMSQG